MARDAEPAPHPWLEEQVYAPKRRRTVDLVTRAVDALVAERDSGTRPGTVRVSLSTIVLRTRQLDSAGQGVSQTAILSNPAARAYYEQYRSTSTSGPHGHRRPGKPTYSGTASPVRMHRDLTRVRQRYLRLSKAELVERVIAAEQAHARQQALWLAANDQLLVWQLRTEEAERRLQARQRSPQTD